MLWIPICSILPDSTEKHWMPDLDIGPTKCVSVREDLHAYWSDLSFANSDLLLPDWAFGETNSIMAATIQALVKAQQGDLKIP